MKLWLVRHAQPLIQKGLCYGQLDVAADHEATQRAAKALAPLLPDKLTLYSSGLKRTQQLACALQEQCPARSFEVDTRLQEMNFGRWEGVAWNRIPKAAFDAWTQEFDTHRFGGAESVRDLLLRVNQSLLNTPLDRDALWVTHAGVIRAVNYLKRNGLASSATTQTWPATAPAFGEWECLTLPF